MGMAFLIRHEDLEVASDCKVFTRHEFASVLDAQTLIERAEHQAKRIRERARSEAQAIVAQARVGGEEERERAYREGLAQAQEELAIELVAIGANAAKTLKSLEGTLVATVMKALRSILKKVDEEVFLKQAMRHVANAIRNEPFVTLRVSSAQEETARQAVDAMTAEVAAPNLVNVVADPQLESGACVIESESGVVDASLETQLAAIHKSLVRSFQLETQAGGAGTGQATHWSKS
jgi:type III secretion protein L